MSEVFSDERIIDIQGDLADASDTTTALATPPQVSGALTPVINTTVGDFRDGGQVTLNGTFGSVGPEVVLFDNFEGGTDGTPIKTGYGSATVGKWDVITGEIAYSSRDSVSGTLSARADMSGHWLNNVTTRLPDTRDVFVSYSALIPSGTRWPGEGHSEGINWKTVWVQGDGTTDDDRVLPAHLSRDRATDPTAHNLHANDAPPATAPGFDSAITRGNWLQTMAWVKGRADNTGALQLWEVTSSGVQQKVNRTSLPTLHDDDDYFERVVMNGYGVQTTNSHPTFDDFYVAVGPGARARVEIGNRPTYGASTVLAITTPTSWTNSQIRTTIRQGAFRSGQTAYLYVVGADGVVSERGHPITIGSGPPPPPAIAHVSQVYVKGPGLTGQTSANGQAFRMAAGIHNTFGYSVPAGTNQVKSIPWNGGVNQIALRFDSNVAGRLQQGDLVVRGVNSRTYTTSGFGYDTATNTGVWTLSSVITNDKVRLFLDDAQLPGLDGEWVNGGATETYPSGNGTAGGDFSFRVDVLRGDATQDGRVNALDLAFIKQRQNRTATIPGSGRAIYSAFADLTGDGSINALDLSAARARLNNGLPSGDPATLFGGLPISA